MSYEIHQLWQCNYCTASFASSNLLKRHFDEYQSRAAEAEDCRAHANANAAEIPEDLVGSDDEEPDRIKRNTICPFPNCNRTTSFPKAQQLRVHFRQHVTCDEVCVRCFKVFRAASEYIRHAREHNDAIEENITYTERRCARLIKRSNEKLMALLRGSNGNGGKKRTWDEAAIASDAANNDFKLNGHGRMSTSDALDAINPFNHPDMEQVLPTGLHTTGPTQVAVELPRIAEEVNFGFPIQPQPHESILFPDEDDFTPSLFYHMNFARYPPSAGPRMEDLIHAVGISIEELQHNI